MSGFRRGTCGGGPSSSCGDRDNQQFIILSRLVQLAVQLPFRAAVFNGGTHTRRATAMFEPLSASTDRRRFLSLLGGGTLAAAVGMVATQPSRAWANPHFSSYPFALGVASGEPVPDGVVLWTELAPEPTR